MVADAVSDEAKLDRLFGEAIVMISACTSRRRDDTILPARPNWLADSQSSRSLPSEAEPDADKATLASPAKKKKWIQLFWLWYKIISRPSLLSVANQLADVSSLNYRQDIAIGFSNVNNVPSPNLYTTLPWQPNVTISLDYWWNSVIKISSQK